MRVKIYTDERYPILGIAEPQDLAAAEVEVNTAVFVYWRKVMREFEAVQRSMGRILAAHKVDA